MGDPKTIRFNDADDMNRLGRFEAACKNSASKASEVIRQLTDAYIRYVTDHGHAPNFPVELKSIRATKRKAKA